MLRIAIVVVLLISIPFAFGDTFEFSFNNDAGTLKYGIPAGAAIPIQGNSDFQFGMLANKYNNYLFEAGLLVKGEMGEDAGGWLAVGSKALAGIIHNYIPGKTQNVGAITIGGELGFIFPAAKKFSVAFYDYFGPGAATFGDADRAYQWGAHIDYDLNSGSKIYLEYREADFRIISTKQSTTLDSGTYAGIRLTLN
jgi:hypothetical protein